ncbi:SRPBCC domain-containing protein [Streptomyces sp. NPDC052396]|uniref:SRPBCC domain-containing protein n=1 Tax=Streptomyces sp. NPDC052396 TaxID=3365689 RepID=UPI0037D0D425
MTSSPTPFPAVRRERTLSAPPATVYRAWLDPEILQRWLAPGTLELARAEVDERVGGRFRVWQTQSNTPIGGFDAELLELVPNERIVFRWGFVGPDRDAGPRFDSLLTVTLHPVPEGTRLIIVHERLDALAAAMPDVAKQIGGGWDSVLDQLAVAVKA